MELARKAIQRSLLRFSFSDDQRERPCAHISMLPPPSPTTEGFAKIDRYVAAGHISEDTGRAKKLELLDLASERWTGMRPRGTPASASGIATALSLTATPAAAPLDSTAAPAPAVQANDLYALIAAGTIPADLIKTYLARALLSHFTTPTTVHVTVVPTSMFGHQGARLPHARAPLAVRHPASVSCPRAFSSQKIVTFKSTEVALPFFNPVMLEDGAALVLVSVAPEPYDDLLIDGVIDGGCGTYWNMTLDVSSDGDTTRVVLIDVRAMEWLNPSESLLDSTRCALLETIRRVPLVSLFSAQRLSLSRAFLGVRVAFF